MLTFLNDLANYCNKYNIDFSKLTRKQQNDFIRFMLKNIAHNTSYVHILEK